MTMASNNFKNLTEKYGKTSLNIALHHRNVFIEIDDKITYQLCRVQTNAKGVVLRERKTGFDIKTKKQQVCRAGDFLIAEMDARFGGYGIVPDELDGAIVSSHYFLFEIDETILDKRYLELYCKTQDFFKQIEAQGSTNYAAIRAKHVLNYTIPLPSLSEQQRLVSRLAGVQSAVEKVQLLRGEQEAAWRCLQFSIFKELLDTAPLIPISAILAEERAIVSIDPATVYKQITVKVEHKGVILMGLQKGSDIGSLQLRARAGQFIISKIDARNGSMGIIPLELDNGIVTNDFPVFSFSDKVNPKFF